MLDAGVIVYCLPAYYTTVAAKWDLWARPKTIEMAYGIDVFPLTSAERMVPFLSSEDSSATFVSAEFAQLFR
jgi:hypothetical protein